MKEFRKIPLSAYKWFDGKERLLTGIKNKLEAAHRLRWLSEGSLKYHLLRNDIPHGGDKNEKELYAKFLASMSPTKE